MRPTAGFEWAFINNNGADWVGISMKNPMASPEVKRLDKSHPEDDNRTPILYISLLTVEDVKMLICGSHKRKKIWHKS
jgi:hypothetical protein